MNEKDFYLKIEDDLREKLKYEHDIDRLEELLLQELQYTELKYDVFVNLMEGTIRVTVDLSAVIDSAHFAINGFTIEQEERENKTNEPGSELEQD
ncbi:MAG: hypothetical protein ACE5JU_10385 [Candidatus Binatia bacterium]